MSNIEHVQMSRLCLICGEAVLLERDLEDSPTKAVKTGENIFPGCEGSLVLNERLQIYFTISKLLKLTEEQCVKLITSGGDSTQLPSQKGTQLCASCESVVNEAISYHLKVLELNGKIDELGVALREKLEKSGGGEEGLGRWGRVLSKRGGGPFYSAAQIDAEKGDNTDATRIVKIEVDPNDIHLMSSDTELDQDEPHYYPFETKPLSAKMPRKKQNKYIDSEMSDSDSDYEPSEPPSNSRKRIKGPTGADRVLKPQTHHCKYCQSIYGTKHGFRQHLKIHRESRKLDNKFDCSKCGHPNLSEETLRRHLSKFHDTMRNTCKICGHVAHRRGLHEKHMLSKHNITIWSPISDGQVSNEGATGMIDTNRYGEDVNFATGDAINEVGVISRIPQSGENQQRSSVTGDSTQIVKPQSQTINTKPDPYYCEQCKIAFNSLRTYQRHKAEHRESEAINHKYDCTECGFPNSSEKRLQYHKRIVHHRESGNQKSRTDMNKNSVKLNDREKLRQSNKHISVEGDDDKNDANDGVLTYVNIEESRTPVYEKKEAYDSDLQRTSVNTSSALYSCEKCKVVYKSLRSYQRHQAEHRASEAISHQYDCDECGFPISSEKRLLHHKKYGCHWPNPSMLTRPMSQLQNQNINTNGKFTCLVCNAYFRTAYELSQHMNAGHQKGNSSKGEGCESLKDRQQRPTVKKMKIHDALADGEDEGSATDPDSDNEWFPPNENLNSSTKYQDTGKDSDIEPMSYRKCTKSGSGYYSCEKCNAVYNSLRSYQRHAAEHRASEEINNKYDCNDCGFPNSSERRLLRHKRYVHQEVTKLTCKICGHHVLRPIQLRMHMRRHKPSLQTTKFGRTKRYLENIQADGKLACLICKAYYNSTESLARHMGEHEKSKAINGKFDCDICSFPSSSEHRLRLHKNSKHGKTLPTCKLCNKTFARPNILRIHMNLHTEYDKTFNPTSGKYCCQFCNASFRTARGIQSHQHGKHKEEFQSSMSALCSQCGKRFCTNVALRKHIRRVHENLFKFSCDVCGKGFDNKTSFSTHQQIHEEIRFKRFVCEICGVDYSHKKTLQDHTARFHPDPSKSTEHDATEKVGSHPCKYCNEVFPFRYILIRHTQTHKELYNFDCNVCGKSYISRSSLRLHIEICHSAGQNKFSCEFCGKVFLHKHYVICHYKFCKSRKQSIN